MAFLDNIKISVKIISAVILLALVSAGVTSSGVCPELSRTEYRAFWRTTRRPRVELARVTRRIGDLGYYALAVITYAPTLAEPKSRPPPSNPPSRRAVGTLVGREIQPAPQGRV